MAAVLEVALVPALPRSCVPVLALEETMGDRLGLAHDLVDRLVPRELAPYLADPVLCLVVLWLSLAGGVVLWWLVRGITIWLKKPRVRECKPAPSPTLEDQMKRATHTYEMRMQLIDLSALPDDAKKQAKKEAESQYMWEIQEILKCTPTS